MAVSFDSAAAPGTAEEAAALVDAVMAASQVDELDWIEWKSSLDLSGKTVRGILARHILGLANRLPEQSAAHASGRGFVVVGAEPGNRYGVAAADPADLLQGIDSFLGPERPSWAMQYYDRDGLPVLVVTVAAPRPGDPVFTLHKELHVVSPNGKRKEYPRGNHLRSPSRSDRGSPAREYPRSAGTARRTIPRSWRVRALRLPAPGMRQRSGTGAGARCWTS